MTILLIIIAIGILMFALLYGPFKTWSVKRRKYPYIGSTGETYSAIVLFTSPRTGVVINQNDSLFQIGYTSDGWEEQEFRIIGDQAEATAKLEVITAARTYGDVACYFAIERI